MDDVKERLEEIKMWFNDPRTCNISRLMRENGDWLISTVEALLAENEALKAALVRERAAKMKTEWLLRRYDPGMSEEEFEERHLWTDEDWQAEAGKKLEK